LNSGAHLFAATATLSGLAAAAAEAPWFFRRRCLYSCDANDSAIEFKRQMVVMLDGSPHVIEDMHTSAPPDQTQAPHPFAPLITGASSTASSPKASACRGSAGNPPRYYGYAQGDTRIFTDIETSDEFEFATNNSASAAGSEGDESIKRCGSSRLLDIVLPPQISLKVVDTARSRSDLNSSWKEARLEPASGDGSLFIVTGHHPRGHRRKEIPGKGTSGNSRLTRGVAIQTRQSEPCPPQGVKARNPRPEAPAFILVKRAIRD